MWCLEFAAADCETHFFLQVDERKRNFKSTMKSRNLLLQNLSIILLKLSFLLLWLCLKQSRFFYSKRHHRIIVKIKSSNLYKPFSLLKVVALNFITHTHTQLNAFGLLKKRLILFPDLFNKLLTQRLFMGIVSISSTQSCAAAT